jgi:hypothetical protein
VVPALASRVKEQSMGQWKIREKWQAFKKKFPAFEKNKNFKSDVGPQMDQFETACENCLKGMVALEKQLADMMKVGLSLQAALKGYKGVMDDMERANPKLDLWHDFMTGPTWANNANFAVRQALEQKLSDPQKFKIDFQVK